EAFAGPSDHSSCRHPHAIEPDTRQRMRRDHIEPFDNGKARSLGGNYKGGNSLRSRRFAGAGEDDVEIGDAGIRDPGFLPVKNVVVPVAYGPSEDTGDVRA